MRFLCSLLVLFVCISSASSVRIVPAADRSQFAIGAAAGPESMLVPSSIVGLSSGVGVAIGAAEPSEVVQAFGVPAAAEKYNQYGQLIQPTEYEIELITGAGAGAGAGAGVGASVPPFQFSSDSISPISPSQLQLHY